MNKIIKNGNTSNIIERMICLKRIAVSLLVGIFVISVVLGYSDKLSCDLAENIVRLHIVANSNELHDQEIKLKVRDNLLEYMEGFDGNVENFLQDIENKANEVLDEEGLEYRAVAQFGRFHFPTKYYEGFALPRGEYDAVRITLGKAEGENWWCVLFPPLCMVDAATGEREELMRETFGENYSVVAEGKGAKFNIKFRLAELF